MMRITKAWLEKRVFMVNTLLGRPVCLYNAGATAADQNIGHLLFDKDGGGYKLVEIIGYGGVERSWSKRLSPRDMDLFLDGIVNGISLRIAQEERVQLAKQLKQVGLTPDAALYGSTNVALLHSTKDGI